MFLTNFSPGVIIHSEIYVAQLDTGERIRESENSRI